MALQETGAPDSGLLASVRRVGASIVSIVHSHAELATLELERERTRYARLALLAIVGLFFLALGVIVATFFVIVLFWDSQRLVAIGFVTVLYIGIGAGTLLIARKQAGEGKPLFSATLEALRKDRDYLNRD